MSATTTTQPTGAPAMTDEAASKAFSTSILISATRCLLAYVIFPWVLPAVGLADSIGPGIGLVVGLVALVSNVVSIRRFWRANHRWKWPISALNVSVIALVTVLVVEDIAHLL